MVEDTEHHLNPSNRCQHISKQSKEAHRPDPSGGSVSL